MFGFGEDEEEQKEIPPMKPLPFAPDDQQPAKPPIDVNQYIRDKYSLGGFSDAERQKLVDENKKEESGFNWGAALSGLGAGIAGRDAGSAAKSVMDRDAAKRAGKLSEFDKSKALAMDSDKHARQMDPNSQESKLAQDLFVSMGGNPEQAKGITAAQFQQFSPALEMKYKIAQNAEEKKYDRDFKERMLAMQAQEKKDMMAMKKQEGMSEGRKAVDKDYAKDYNEWTSTGRSTLNKNLTALEEARDALAKDSSLTGGLTGSFPDALTADKVLNQRRRVQGAVQNSLKATLGSQFTEKEGERILKNAYNEKASPQTNIESLNALITQLKSQQQVNDAKAQHFEKEGTLSGFQAPKEMMANSPAANDMGGGDFALVVPPGGGAPKKIPKARLREALAAGGKLAGPSNSKMAAVPESSDDEE